MIENHHSLGYGCNSRPPSATMLGWPWVVEFGTKVLGKCEGNAGVSEFRVTWEVALRLEVSSSLHRVVLYLLYISSCVLCIALFMWVLLGGVESSGLPHVLRIMHGRTRRIRVGIERSQCVPKARRTEQGGSGMANVSQWVRVRGIGLSQCVPRARCVPKARRTEQGGSGMANVSQWVRVRGIGLSQCVPRARCTEQGGSGLANVSQ
ncbi:unnamed protein product [Lactuca saligna]|uniref:Uncharacterized protein n=1 Tax=Lactuca saligna TaxID=75948 RepID=A0AA35YAD7_LACSI|nr:unnamed protein product [Lactuca saligna]